MTTTKELLSDIEAHRDGQRYVGLPLETRLRNTCPACGCRFIDDFARAFVFVTGPLKRGQCQKCGWVGTK